MSVGLVFLVRDPEISRLRVLVEYLRAVSDEFIFMVDDRTAQPTVDEIRTWPGAIVSTVEWRDDFSWARNQALPLVQSEWTAYFDPDELPNHRLLEFIREESSRPKSATPVGFLFDTHNFWAGSNLAPHLDSDWHLRMWQTGRGEFYKPVHEQVKLDGLQEGQTRATALVAKAPADAFIIHSKPSSGFGDAMQLYDAIEKRSTQ